MSNMHTSLRRLLRIPAAVLAALALSSCGGGDAYTGLWSGTLDDARPVSAIVLSDGTYYLKYAPTAGNFGGLVRGTGDFHGATFKSVDGGDYLFTFPPQGVSPAQITGKIGGHQTLTGRLNSTPLKLTYVKAFEPHGSLADLAGSYPGKVMFMGGPRSLTFHVTADGKLSTVIDNCSVTGEVAPRRDDAFDIRLTFSALPCAFPGAVFEGVAIYSQDLQQLEAAVTGMTRYLGPQAITFVARKGQ